MPKYKLTEDGKAIIMTDGKPTVIGDDEKEYGIDALGAQDRINAISAEAKGYRTKAADRKKDLEAFVGISDPAAAISALQKVGSMDKDQEKALENMKNTINTAWEEKEKDWETEKTTLTGKLFTAKVGSQFATSEAIKKTVLTPDIAATFFGKHFDADGTAKDDSGNVIYSKEKPGEPAEFEEAIGIIIENYPGKESILRGTGSEGGGGKKFQGRDGGEEKTTHDKIKAGLAART